jgi:hypothetical protein
MVVDAHQGRDFFVIPNWGSIMTLNAEQLIARLYAIRKDYADDAEDETYQALHQAFMFISYNVGAFKEFVVEEQRKATEKKSAN